MWTRQHPPPSPQINIETDLLTCIKLFEKAIEVEIKAAMESASVSSALAECTVSKLVVLPAFLRITENFIG